MTYQSDAEYLKGLYELLVDRDGNDSINVFIKYAWNIPPEDVLAAIVLYGNGAGATISHDTHGYNVTQQEEEIV